MKKLAIVSLLTFLAFSGCSQSGDKIIIIETTMGDIEVLLYDETPLHQENMLKLIQDDFFVDQLFHRVIKNFMIQGGDPHSINAPKGQRLGTGGPGYTIPAEIKASLYHKKGALSAARMGDDENPMKNSSGSQFYIVQGQVFTNAQLDQMETMESTRYVKRHLPFTAEQREVYTTIGGSPHLDGGYTVFGEVTKGLDIVDRIATTATDNYDRPIEDIVYSIKVK